MIDPTRRQVRTAGRGSRAAEADATPAPPVLAVADAAQEPMLICSTDGKVVHANAAAASLFGRPTDDLKGCPIASLVTIDGTAPGAAGKAAVVPAVAKAKTRDRGTIDAEVIVQPLDDGASALQAVSIRDVGERNRLAEEVALARDQVRAANKSRSEFLAMMSHELRTPLNAVIGYSEIIREETFGPVGSPKYREYVTDIHESGRRLLNIINDILDLSKLDTGGLSLAESRVDVCEVVAACVRLLQERADTDGVALEVNCGDRMPTLRADERKLKQIFASLLSNAIKFTDRGGKVTVNVWCRPESGYVFQVTDTGIGMALDDIPKALTPFGQIDSDLNRRYEGTGVGLPLTKALVEMHSGSIDVQSRVGVGTTVTIRFPAERIGGALDAARAKAG